MAGRGSNQTQQLRQGKPKKSRNASISSANLQTPEDFSLASRRQQPSRAVKSSPTATRRSRKMSRDDYETGDMTPPAFGSSMVRSSSMSSSSSERGGSVRYTKTGRISKALKGQPVHRCEVCDKYYTRAEHLRRHQLNHKGARPWLCDVPGCEKSLEGKGFYREDLLLRHKEDHKSIVADLGRSQAPSSDSYQDPRRRADDPTTTLGEGYMRSASIFSTRSNLAHDKSFSGAEFLHQNSLVGGVPCDTSYTPSLGPVYSPLVTDAFYTPSLYSSPPPEQTQSFQPYFPTSGGLSSSTFPGGDDWHNLATSLSRSRSPASEASSFTVPAWHNMEPKPKLHTMSPSSSDQSGFMATAASSRGDVAATGHWAAFGEGIVSFADLDVFDSLQIDKDLSGLAATVGESHAGSPFAFFQQLYMPAFWENFYPTFPTIHCPTFYAADDVPPLLRALMTAIGASYVDTPAAKIVARTLRETCSRLVEKRPIISHSLTRVWDVHSVFLSEALSLYRSRRPLTALSPRFEALCAMLQFDPAVISAKPAEELAALTYGPEVEAATNIRLTWIQNESKRRIYLACYVLEAQQALLFQRTRNISDGELPFISSSPLWEAHRLEDWQQLAQREAYGPNPLYEAINRQQAVAHDSFTSAVITAYVTRAQSAGTRHPSGLDTLLPHPRNCLSYHAMMLAKHTPVRDLLAVSGESFVLGEKLATHEQYKQAVMDLRIWVGSESAARAVRHAATVLRTSFDNGRCGLLHEEWSLYLAALACWAVGIWARPHNDAAPAPVLGSTSEGMRAFLAAVDADSAEVVDASTWTHTRACLAWVKSRISGRVGGLVEDAVNVLDRLATRG